MKSCKREYTKTEIAKLTAFIYGEIRDIFKKHGKPTKKRSSACRLISRHILRSNIEGLSNHYLSNFEHVHIDKVRSNILNEYEIIDNIMYQFPQEWEEIIDRYCNNWEKIEEISLLD